MKTLLKFATIAIAITIVALSCARETSNDTRFVDETFRGLWAETEFIYQFKVDGTFELETRGHYDFAKFQGKYFILDSVFYLTPQTDWQVFDGVLKERLTLTDDKCLRDRECNYYCTSIDELNKRIELEFSWEEKVVAILDSLPIVKAKRAELSRPNEEFYEAARFHRRGIIKVNDKELYHFEFIKPRENEDRSYLTFLIQKDPFRIYLHNLQGNTLTLLLER